MFVDSEKVIRVVEDRQNSSGNTRYPTVSEILPSFKPKTSIYNVNWLELYAKAPYASISFIQGPFVKKVLLFNELPNDTNYISFS